MHERLLCSHRLQLLLFALIPVVGGVIKGVGRLLLKLGKSAADNAVVIREIVTFLNRVGHGNAVQFVKELSFVKYQDELIKKFNESADKLDETLNAVKRRFTAVLSREMLTTIDLWIERMHDQLSNFRPSVGTANQWVTSPRLEKNRLK